MKILFIDESFDLNSNTPFFILGGVVISDAQWSMARDKINEIKRINNIANNHEIKWRWIFNKNDKKNPLLHLSLNQRLDDIIKPMLKFIEEMRLELFTTLTHINDLREDFLSTSQYKNYNKAAEEEFKTYYYHKNYENIVQRFQYYLQDCQKKSQDSMGIIICDNRNNSEDEALKKLHLEMLQDTPGKRTIKYENLIEHLLISPSHFSIGIQFADIVSGMILNRLRKNSVTEHLFQIIKNNFNTRDDNGTITSEGRGVVKLPKRSPFWRTN